MSPLGEVLRPGGRATVGAATALLVVLLAGCGIGSESPSAGSQTSPPVPEQSASDAADDAHDGHTETETPAARPLPLRAGERRVTLRMPAPYTPSAPTGKGTDDYRCFLLDPELERDAFLTGTNVIPGSLDVVHHVILFRVPAGEVTEAEELDESTPGEGWTCFGNAGLGSGPQVDDAPWLGAWAPGGTETVLGKGLGVSLERGSRIVMQVHYNLLAGSSADVSAARLRIAPAGAGLTPLETMLMPAPVELPCRVEHEDGPLCDRAAALADVKQRFGQGPGATADLLHVLCNSTQPPGEVQSCTRAINETMTIRGVAGHMHLLGREIKVELNPGTPDAETILDIPVWNFDDQGAQPVDPVQLDPGETVRVTCRHVQWLRDRLPAFEGQPDRYVVWGEGTTDEMCLGILQVTRP